MSQSADATEPTPDPIRDAALAAARSVFATRGYARTTYKGIAAAAGIAPAVLRKYYDSKGAMFAAAVRLPTDPASAIPSLLGPGIDGLGERLVRFWLDTVGDQEVREDLMAMIRAGASAAQVTRSLQAYLEVNVVDRIVAAVGVPDARMRVALISSFLVGIAAGRYLMRIEPLASASEEQVVRLVAPTIQALLDPRVPLPGSAA
ncbi:MAG: TetR family transcriptional regulator [Actinobacteria bacterium]|nr:TetR family transcriptional regulator [Actinomycetota bacterium]